jgi:hypothetical protein
MANKIKDTVEYFPFFVRNGRTLYVLQNKYGLAGVGFFTQLLRWLAQSPGHYYTYVEDFDKDRMNQYCGLNETDIRVMIGDMVKTGKLDRELWEERGVIYSKDFVDELSELYRKRKTELPTKERVMDETASICRNIPAHSSIKNEGGADFPENTINTERLANPRQYGGNMAEIFRQPAGNREQSRVEESIESRVEETIQDDCVGSQERVLHSEKIVRGIIAYANGLKSFPREKRELPNIPYINQVYESMSYYTEDEIKNALDNYAAIKADPEEYDMRPFKTLVNFFTNDGIPKFISESDPWTNYRRKMGVVESREEREAREANEAYQREKELSS